MARRRGRSGLPPTRALADEIGWRRLGVEHEYTVLRDEDVIDARRLLPTLDLGGRRLDPGDPRAVRCAWGGVITADGRELEVATPPVRLSSHRVADVVELCRAGRAAMAAALPEGVEIAGYSTHLNVEVDDRLARRTALDLARRFGPALGLMLDRTDSPGLLVRPRHGRLELGGEHLEGDGLRAALVFAIGAVVACERARRRRGRMTLPDELDLVLRPTPERFGWFVARDATGSDLYRPGRAGAVRAAGRVSSVQSMLTATWTIARAHVEGEVDATDLALVDERIDGRAPLPCEVEPPLRGHEPADVAVDVGRVALPSVMEPRTRRDVAIVAEAATWHALVLRLERDGRRRWVRVPGRAIDAFLASLDGGELDQWLAEVAP